MTDHDKLPDVVLYDAKRKWLFLVEVVTSHGPVSPTRMVDLQSMLAACPAGAVYVSAFPDFGEFRKHMRNIAWETEVWLCDAHRRRRLPVSLRAQSQTREKNHDTDASTHDQRHDRSRPR